MKEIIGPYYPEVYLSQDYHNLLCSLKELKKEKPIDKKILYLKWIETLSYKNFDKCNNNVKRGLTEEYFKNYIINSDLTFFINKTININGKEFNPDFIVQKNKVNIIVEIDEIYACKSGLPIHYYVNSEKGRIYSDYKWNETLRDSGFQIIRFAEYQILAYPQECINFINYIFSCIKNLKFPNRRKFKYIYPKFTYENSILLSYHHVREKMVKSLSLDERIEFLSFIEKAKDGEWNSFFYKDLFEEKI